jgi:predicted nucleotidyltransferase
MNKAVKDGELPCDLSFASSAVLYRLRALDLEKVDEFAECGGGLGRRIVKCASEARDLDGLYRALNTKRYTNARIRRAVISCLLETKEEIVASFPEFTSLLAANEKGLSLLRACTMPVLSTPSDIRRLDKTALVDLYLSAERFITLCYKQTKAEYEYFSKKPSIIVNK